ncbi:hypothetical protein SAMN03159448_03800 [Sinorhizobium sp. NFACC03]|nr:hypothetical protein SAMN03159448_03800 [Sinorhizobium sp. NFACC03]
MRWGPPIPFLRRFHCFPSHFRLFSNLGLLFVAKGASCFQGNGNCLYMEIASDGSA